MREDSKVGKETFKLLCGSTVF